MPSRPLGKATTAAVLVLGVVVVVAPERRALVDAAAGVAGGLSLFAGGITCGSWGGRGGVYGSAGRAKP